MFPGEEKGPFVPPVEWTWEERGSIAKEGKNNDSSSPQKVT